MFDYLGVRMAELSDLHHDKVPNEGSLSEVLAALREGPDGVAAVAAALGETDRPHVVSMATVLRVALWGSNAA